MTPPVRPLMKPAEKNIRAKMFEMQVPKRNFQGALLTAVYDDWSPFCVVTRAIGDDSQWSLGGGMMPAVFQALGQSLNFTIR